MMIALSVLTVCSTPERQSFGTVSKDKMSSKTVVLIHGMFLTPVSWQNWKLALEKKGYKVIIPAWPYHETSVLEQRKNHPDGRLGALTLESVINVYKVEIGKLKEKPILIGHSMGGLIVQKLMEEDLGAAGIAIHSAPTKGILSFKYSFLKSNWAVISPFANKEEAYLPTLDEFSYAFLNELPIEKRKETYDMYAVPESRLVGNAPTKEIGKVDFTKKKSPLLFLSGKKDHIIPYTLNDSNFQKYEVNHSQTDFIVLEKQSHWVLLEPSWEDTFREAMDWLEKL